MLFLQVGKMIVIANIIALSKIVAIIELSNVKFPNNFCSLVPYMRYAVSKFSCTFWSPGSCIISLAFDVESNKIAQPGGLALNAR